MNFKTNKIINTNKYCLIRVYKNKVGILKKYILTFKAVYAGVIVKGPRFMKDQRPFEVITVTITNKFSDDFRCAVQDGSQRREL